MANEIIRAHGDAEGSAILYQKGFSVRDAMKFATRAGDGAMTMRGFVRIPNSDQVDVFVRGKLETASPRFLGISCGPGYGWELHMASGRVPIADVLLRMRRPKHEPPTEVVKNTIEKLKAIYRAQPKERWATAGLAKKIGVSPKTIYRAMKQMRLTGEKHPILRRARQR